MTLIPCYNFPTRLLVLDDNADFLTGLRHGLCDKYQCISITHPSQALDMLNNNREWVNKLLTDGVSRIYQDEDPLLFSVSFDISLIKTQVYNENRFNNIAVVIVDYDMPEINGLDFIKSLNNPQLKIIMLTGKVAQDLVITAFNNKEIDRYVSKSDPNYMSLILRYIEELQTEFFIECTKFIFEMMKPSTRSLLANKQFIDLFNRVICDEKITEYFLLDESLSFFMQDEKAQNQIYLITKSVEDLDDLFELAKEDPRIPFAVLQQLKERRVMTHFNSKEESLLAAKYWKLIEATPIDDKKEHYYAILKNNENFKMDRSQIKSYFEFLQQDEMHIACPSESIL